jgi:S-DNA-T family DNA segregation ATPase FtsK/SpoIIIE
VLINEKWTGGRPAPIPVMPEIITFNSLVADEMKIPIGLSSEDITPVYINLKDKHYFIISGTSESGKSNKLIAIAKRFKTLDNSNLIVFDSRSQSLSDLKEISDTYTTECDIIIESIKALMPILNDRHDRYTQDKSLTFDPYAIVIDDLQYFFDNADSETRKRVEAVLEHGKGLNIYLFAAGQHKDINNLCAVEKAVREMVSEGVGIILGGKLSSHAKFESDMSYSQKDIALKTYEGYLIYKGKTTCYKAIFAY